MVSNFNGIRISPAVYSLFSGVFNGGSVWNKNDHNSLNERNHCLLTFAVLAINIIIDIIIINNIQHDIHQKQNTYKKEIMVFWFSSQIFEYTMLPESFLNTRDWTENTMQDIPSTNESKSEASLVVMGKTVHSYSALCHSGLFQWAPAASKIHQTKKQHSPTQFLVGNSSENRISSVKLYKSAWYKYYVLAPLFVKSM